MKKKILIGLGSLIGLFIIIVIIGVLTSDSGEPISQSIPPQVPASITQAEPEYIEITASELYKAYDNNEIAADQKYKGKLLKVTGVINNISKDILGDPYIVLTGGGEYEVWGVQCTFPNTEAWKDKLASFNKGDSVSVKGKCTGYLINVLLEVQ